MKIIGLFIIFFSSVFLGLYSSYMDKCSLFFMSEILRFIEHTKEQIKHFNAPLNEIYNSFNCKDKTMKLFLENISNNGLTQAVESSRKSLPYEYHSTLNEFALKLGKTNRDDQVKLCDYCCKQLEKVFNEEKEKLKTNSKLKITLSIYIGLLLIILLL